MFDQILALVKERMASNNQTSPAIPANKQDEVNNEIASHITNGLQSHAKESGTGDLLSKLQNAVGSGSMITNSIEGGLIGTLGSKFGLSPMVTGAIAAALPSILQKFANKANDPNDNSITQDSITKSLSSKGNGLGNLFN